MKFCSSDWWQVCWVKSGKFVITVANNEVCIFVYVVMYGVDVFDIKVFVGNVVAGIILVLGRPKLEEGACRGLSSICCFLRRGSWLHSTIRGNCFMVPIDNRRIIRLCALYPSRWNIFQDSYKTYFKTSRYLHRGYRRFNVITRLYAWYTLFYEFN